jgi:immune inhibitor A
MRSRIRPKRGCVLRRLLIWLFTLALAAGLAGSGALASPPEGGEEDLSPVARGETARPDDRPSPLSEKRRALKREALARVIKGQARVQRRGGEKVVRLAPGQYVQLEQQDSDEIFTILAEFGDRVGPYAGEVDAPPSGPLHNQIPRPDRNWDGGSTDDNTTYWVPDCPIRTVSPCGTTTRSSPAGATPSPATSASG